MEVEHQTHRCSEDRSGLGPMFIRGFSLYGYFMALYTPYFAYFIARFPPPFRTQTTTVWAYGTTVWVNSPVTTRWVLENNFKSPMLITGFPLHPFITQTTTCLPQLKHPVCGLVVLKSPLENNFQSPRFLDLSLLQKILFDGRGGAIHQKGPLYFPY